MRRVTRWSVFFTACLTAAVGVSAARAEDDKPAGAAMDRKTLDGAIYANLRKIIDHGANLYNGSDWNGCYRLWEGTLMSLRPILDHRNNLQKAIDQGIAAARLEPMLYERCWILRRTALNKIRADIATDYPDMTKALDEKAKREKGRVENPGAVTNPKPKDNGDTRVVTPKPNKTLWDRLGGEAGVTKIVDDFANGVVADPKVDFFRHGKFKPEAEEIAKMKREIVEQVSQATGGPLKYNGPDMKKIHKDMGITGKQFDAAVGHLKSALQKNKVADKDTATILAGIKTYRSQIVAPKKPDDNKPVDKKPEDKKPADKKPADKKPADTKPDDNKPAIKTSISGKVTYEGKPLSGGTILFEGKDGRISAPISKDGDYTLTGILKPGEYRVVINTKPVMRLPGTKLASGTKPPVNPKEEPKKETPKLVPIPAKYSDPKTSPLVIEVVEGKQSFDIMLAK